MNGATKTADRVPNETSVNSLTIAQRVLLGLFVIAMGFSVARMFSSIQMPVSEGIWETIVLLLAVTTTLVSLAGQLPVQNVLLGTVVIGVIGGGIHALGALTGLPFGPIIYTHDGGPLLFNALPWFIPFVWIIVILNARGVARLILRPWRKLRIYGYWLIGITTALTLVFVLGFEPFATRLRHYWLWTPTKLPVNWYGTPLSDFLGWLVATLLILAFSTPALMKKKPAKSFPEYHPLVVWIAINLLFMAGAFSQHLLIPAVISGMVCVAVIPFAIRGATW